MYETEFLKVIKAEPTNPIPRLVYADWLDEQGDLRGELLRIQQELRRIGVPHRAAKEARMHELLNEGIKPLTITRNNSIGMPMVLIFPGDFVMGSPEDEKGRLDNEKQVEVRLTQGFWLAKYPVTQSEWQRVMGTQPWRERRDGHEAPNMPATEVSWKDVVAFCEKLTQQEHPTRHLAKEGEYTLPTEAQWEYACRAGTTTRFYFGEQERDLKKHAWYREKTGMRIESVVHGVGQKPPNPWGLYDMHGNINEWCRDGYLEHLPGGTDPEWFKKNWSRVYRGGSWTASADNCRSAHRDRVYPSYRSPSLGFRVARVLSE